MQPSLVYVVGAAVDENGAKIPGINASVAATLNRAASANNSAYDIYSVTVPNADDINVGATINGHNQTGWTTLDVFNLNQCPF
jgi:hypothetical protein